MDIIKKISKQPTEKRQYNIKDFVVYPKHGVGKIVAVEKAKIAQRQRVVEVLKRSITVPARVLMCLHPYDKPRVFTRSWCMYEGQFISRYHFYLIFICV